MANQATYIIQLRDRFSRVANTVSRSARTASRSVGALGASLKKMGYHMTSLRSIITASYGAALIAFPIKKAAEFEAKMIDVQRVSEFKTGEFAKFEKMLEKTALHLGKLPSEMGDIAYAAAKLTDNTKELQEYVKLAGQTSTAFDMPGKDAAELIGKFTAMLGTDMAGTKRFLDATNYVSDRFATTGKRVLKATSRSIGEFKGYEQFKMKPELVAGWNAFADSISTTPRLAASGMKMMMGELRKMPGVSWEMLKTPHDAMMYFLKRMNKLDIRHREAILDNLMTKQGGRFVRAAVNSQRELDKVFKDLLTNNKFVDSMLIELEKKLKSAETAMGRIRAVMDFVAISIGNAFLPLIKELTPHIVRMALAFRDFVKAHPMLTKIIMGVIALITVLSVASIVIGLIAVGVGTIVSPVTLVIIGIAAIAAGLVYLYIKSEKVRTAFNNIFAALAPVKEAIGKLWKMITGSPISGGDILGGVFSILETLALGAIKVITFQIDILMLPLRAVLWLFEKIGNVIEWISNADFSGAASSLSQKIGESLGSAHSFLSGAASGMGEYVSSRLNQNTLNGQIEVSASQGSEVKKAEFDPTPAGSVGFNMRNY